MEQTFTTINKYSRRGFNPARLSVAARRRFDRRSTDSSTLILLFRVADVATLVCLLASITFFSFLEAESIDLRGLLDARIPMRQLLVFIPVALLCVLAFQISGVYDRRGRPHFGELTAIVLAATLGTVPIAVTAPLTQWFRVEELLLFWFGSVVLTMLTRRTLREFVGARKDELVRETIIVGSGPQAFSFYRDLSTHPTRRIVGFVDSCTAASNSEIGERLLGSLEEFDRILMTTVVDEVIVALPIKSHYEQIERVIRSCERAGVQCTHHACLFQGMLARPSPKLELDEPFPAVTMRTVEDEKRMLLKRPLDILGALCALAIALPVILAVAVAVKMVSPGPILFVQERYGYRKRRFKMYKFRTMVENAETLQEDLEPLNEATGHAFKIRDDPRLTPIGAFLRRWSLDEIPQFVNVLRGDMTLVGPRPLSVRDVTRFSEAWLMRRFSVRPGLTCLWQVKGRASLSFDEWMALDLQYIDQWSPLLDFWILAMTVPSVFRGTGAA